MDRFGSTTNATDRRSPLDITPHLAKLNRSCRESYWKTLSPDDTRYDQPEVGDALRFGVQYPDEQTGLGLLPQFGPTLADAGLERPIDNSLS